jgi:hypothetical protein
MKKIQYHRTSYHSGLDCKEAALGVKGVAEVSFGETETI